MSLAAQAVDDLLGEQANRAFGPAVKTQVAVAVAFEAVQADPNRMGDAQLGNASVETWIDSRRPADKALKRSASCWCSGMGNVRLPARNLPPSCSVFILLDD